VDVPIPPLSEQQRQQARDAAAQARRRRAEVKQQLRSGELSIAAVLELAADDQVVAHTKVVDILKSQPRVGEVRATKVMVRLRIASNRRLRGLGPNQIDGLKREFGESQERHS